jgi:hypothetical protein
MSQALRRAIVLQARATHKSGAFCQDSPRTSRNNQCLAGSRQQGYNRTQMRSSILAMTCVAGIYCALGFLVMPQGAFFSSDEGLKFIQLQNLAVKGWGDLTIEYPGQELDPQLSYVPINNPPVLIRDGKVFAVYPVFFPALTTPFYNVLGKAGLYPIPLLSGLLTLLISACVARAGGEKEPFFVVLLLGLCTPIAFYSLLFWDHTLGTLLATLALLLIIRNLEQPKRWTLLLAGIALGSAIWVRSELYVMAAVMPVAYLLFGSRRLGHAAFLLVGTVTSLAPLWVFQFVVYGDVIGPHLGHFAWLGEKLPVTTSRLAVLYYTLLEGNSNLALSFLYITAFAASALIVRSRRLHSHTVLISVVFPVLALAAIPNILEAAAGRPFGGLISTVPLLAFSFAALPASTEGSKSRFLLAVSLGYVALVCLATPVDPGLQWGPRFLLPVIPPMTILALNNFRAARGAANRASARRALTASFLLLVAASFLTQLGGLRAMYLLRARDLMLIDDTARLATPYVVTDEYGYAQYVAPLFYEKQFFYVRDQEAYDRLTQTFLSDGIRTFAFVTYPVPYRRAVDPLLAGDGYTVTRLDEQLFQLHEGNSADDTATW